MRETPEQIGLGMSNTDKLLLICILGMVVGFAVAIFDAQRRAYDKGVRDGYRRGRTFKGQE